MKSSKKFFLYIFIIIIIMSIAFFIYSNYFINKNKPNNNSKKISPEKMSINNSTKEPIKLTEFSTKLLSKNENRTNNIRITCNTLNGTIVNPKETFSFCHTIGKPTEDKGYKLANSYGHSGEIIQTIGGGNCQVCSTLYNAVLALKNLSVTERHPHSRPVGYVPEGKDATCAYDYLDFKFINNYSDSIRIDSYVDDNNVYISIYQIQK